MSRNPRTISPDELAPAALHEMESRHITSLFVTQSDGRLEGVVHLHDLWRLELF
jgi:arabinose-5-phosphate isomerase